MFRSQQKDIGGIQPVRNLAVRGSGKDVKFDMSVFPTQQTDGSPGQLRPLDRIALAGREKDMKISRLPAEPLTARGLIDSFESLEIDAAREDLNFGRSYSPAQSL